MNDDEGEEKLFTVTEAERTRTELEPILVEAVECRRRVVELDQSLGQIASRIQSLGGVLVPYARAAQLRRERDRLAQVIQGALERIESTGCVVKDLDTGLLDFPARLTDEDVYPCWRLGEDRIRYWHRPDEGLAGRKPLDPDDRSGKPTIH